MPRSTASTPSNEPAARARRAIGASDVVALFEKRALPIGSDEAQALADDANALASRPGETRTARTIAMRLVDVEAQSIDTFSVGADAATE